MRCPFCSSLETRVVDKRSSENDEAIRRRRECLKCENRFTTYERIESPPLRVVKKDGTRQEYSREKILKGLVRACEKRDVGQDALNSAVNGIEHELRNSGDGEVSTKTLGSLVMKKLKKIDKVAYIRFASVYREFADVADFDKEVQRLMKKR